MEYINVHKTKAVVISQYSCLSVEVRWSRDFSWDAGWCALQAL